MKIMLDVKCDKVLTQNDVIRYNDDIKCFEVVSCECFNNDLLQKIKDLNKEIKNLKSQFSSLKDGVNKKLKDYHDILSVLTEEN